MLVPAAQTPPGEIFTRLDEDLRLVGCECKQVCIVRKSLIFSLSFSNHSCSFLHISFYPRIHDSDEDQPAARSAQASKRMAIGEESDNDRLCVTGC